MSDHQSSQCEWTPTAVWSAPSPPPAEPPQPLQPPQPPVWSPPPAGWGAASPTPPPARPRFLLTPGALVGLGAMLAGAVIELSFSSYHEVNGIQTECTYVNLAPLLFGPVAVVAGLLALVRSGRPGRYPQLERGLGLLAVAVGVVHVLGGLNLFGGVTLTLAGNGPC